MSIGIFDSGVGGLTVVKTFFRNLPKAQILYFGDTARFPYGNKSSETVRRYSRENTQFLLSKGAVAIVVACNTASATAVSFLQKEFSVPIIGVIDGAVFEALQKTKNGRIGIIGTSRTIQSRAYQNAIFQKNPKIEVFSRACPLLVSLIEDGNLPEEIVKKVIAHYLQPLKKKKIDTLILGCTHYPIVQHLIQAELSEEITIVNPAESCVQDIKNLYVSHEKKSIEHIFYVSDDPARFKKIGSTFLQEKIDRVRQKKTF